MRRILLNINFACCFLTVDNKFLVHLEENRPQMMSHKVFLMMQKGKLLQDNLVFQKIFNSFSHKNFIIIICPCDCSYLIFKWVVENCLNPAVMYLYTSNYQSQYRPGHPYIWLNFQPSLDSEDDFCSGWWNVSHYQQSFSGLLSPRQSNSIRVNGSYHL